MIEVNPLHVILFGLAWFSVKHIIVWAWHTYKEHYHPMQEIKIDKRQDRHGHS